MKHILTIILCVLAFSAVKIFAAEPPALANFGIMSFGDATVTCGPGTDSACDSPEGIARMMARWKARGLRGICFRVDNTFLPDEMVVRWPREKTNPVENYLLELPDRTRKAFDLLGTLQAEAAKAGLEVWAYCPQVYSSGAPPEGPGFTSKWLFQNRHGHEHPEVLTQDRRGNKQYMVWEYAYPGARAAKVAEYVSYLKQYGLRRFIVAMRTEVVQMQAAPEHADQFGFNAPVVEEMQRRHSVNILTDPRFDYANPKYNPRDELVEACGKLRGGYLTDFYRKLRRAMNAIDPGIQLAVMLPGDRVGSPLGNWPIEWRTWIDEGLVNQLIVPASLDEGVWRPKAELEKRGYLEASVPVETYHDFIRTSRQPTARVIHTGGPYAAFDVLPPPHADGWLIDQWFELYCTAWAQRWEQWQRDLADFGHIKFIEQDFDDFPERDAGYGGGYGDFAHRPDLRRGPGYWWTLGDGTDARPFAQSQARHGERGLALQLTRDAKVPGVLTGRHVSVDDRRNWGQMLDTSATGGALAWGFWLHRSDATSAFTAYLNDSNAAQHRNQIGLSFGVGAESAVAFAQGGEMTASAAKAPVGKWLRFLVEIDLERRTWSASVSDDTNAAPAVICRDVKYEAQFNAFNWMDFFPQGKNGSVFHLDDIALRWQPKIHATPPGKNIVARDGFETARPGLPLTAAAESPTAPAWTLVAGRSADVVIGSDISYGREHHSLRIRGAGGRARLAPKSFTLQPDDIITLDLDLLPRSDLPRVHFTPKDNPQGADENRIALLPANGGPPLLELRTVNGRWQITTGGKFADTGSSATFDAWNRLQLALDTTQRTYRVSLQIIGSVPRLLHEGPLDSPPATGTPLALDLACLRAKPRVDGPAFDNVLITRVQP